MFRIRKDCGKDYIIMLIRKRSYAENMCLLVASIFLCITAIRLSEL